MIPYILIFALVLFLISLSERLESKYKVLSRIIAVIAIVILSLFAGFRNENVGTDVLVYVKPYLIYMHNLGFKWAYQNLSSEILYICLTWIIDVIGGNINTLLFVITFIISFLVYQYAINNRKETDVVLTYAVYLFIYFGITLNLVRQSIAMAIILYSMKYLRKNDAGKYLLCVLIASGFHSTAIIMLPLYLIYRFIGTQYELIIKFLISGVSIVCVACSKTLIKYMYMLSNKYTVGYINRYLSNVINFNWLWEFIKILFLAIMLIFLRYDYNKKDNKYEKKYFEFCRFLLILDFIFFQLGAIFTFSERFSYYFMIISYSYLLPCLIDSFKMKGKKEKIFGKIIVYFGLNVYFYVVFKILAVSSIIPYMLC